MFGGLLGGFGEMVPSGPKPALAQSLGLGPIDLEGMSDAEAAEALTLLDPAWKDREGAVKGMVTDLMGEVVSMVEPPMRRAMTELYAIRFTGPELAAIDAFFATGTGGKYARESMSMASDPRLMAASMEAMPAMFAMIGQMEERMKERTASLPAPRDFADLSPKERAAIDALMVALRHQRDADDAAVIEAATDALAKGTEGFAAQRMNRGIQQALAGKNVQAL